MRRIFVDIERCMGCKTCEIACAVKYSKTKNLFHAISEKPAPLSRVKVMDCKSISIPYQCRQCPEPFCQIACIAGAIKVENGVVIIDEDKCVHCYSCVMACPYGLIDMDEENKCAIKCNLCPDEEIPRCVVSCPTKALFYGEIDKFKKVIDKRKGKCTI